MVPAEPIALTKAVTVGRPRDFARSMALLPVTA
jgi:hypothetical protein